MPRSTMTLLAAALLWPLGSAWAHPGGHNEPSTAELGEATQTNPEMRVSLARPAEHQVEIVEKDGTRFITSNGIPDHTPGQFPNRGNPNSIASQDYHFQMPLEPQPATGEVRGRVLFGVALNGVPFDPGTAEIWSPQGRTQGGGPSARNAWRYEALTGNINLGLDDHNAHVQPTGAYHYHALPTGLYEKLAGKPASETPDQMILLGYAADGYPIYGVYAHQDAHDADSPLIKIKPSYRVKAGQRPAKSDTSPGGDYDGTFVQDWEYVEGLGDLDEHNGRTGVTPEYPAGTYYYILSEDYPFIPRSFHGTPDRSFALQGGPPASGNNRGPGNNRGEPRDGDRRGGPDGRPPRGEDGDRPRRPPPPGS